MPITPDLFTTAEAAEMLGITSWGIRSAIKNGTLRAVRIDARTNAVAREEIDRYRREHLGQRGRRKKTDQQPATAPTDESETTDD